MAGEPTPPERRNDYTRRTLHDQVQQHEWRLDNHDDQLSHARKDAREAKGETVRVERMITDPKDGLAVKVVSMETAFTKAINRILVALIIAGMSAILSLLGTVFMLLSKGAE